MQTDFERYIAVSAKVKTDDIDWDEAKKVGLTDDEVFVLTYFSDIESQTIRYLKMLLSMKNAYKPDVAAFLTTWNYEEFFHGFELGRLLKICDRPLEYNRVENTIKKARFNEILEALFSPILSRLFYNQFPAVYLSFGAVQELTTLKGYESLQTYTKNPVLKTLCERIAKQERRHFAWYFNNAREWLTNTRGAETLTRKILEFNWVPVGAGVKSPDEVKRLFNILFPNEMGRKIVSDIDEKIGTLPGLNGINLMTKYFNVI